MARRTPRLVRVMLLVAAPLAAFRCVPPHASAAPFDAHVVAADAKFVAFVDVDAARSTAIGKALLARLIDDPDYAELERNLLQFTGFMPASDITDLTFYGDRIGARGDGVLMLHARGDVRTLRDLVGGLPAFRSEPRDQAHAGREIVSWEDERTRDRAFASFVDAGTIAFGRHAATLAKALDVLGDPDRSLAANKTFPRPDEAAVRVGDTAGPHAWVFVAASKVGAAPAFAGNAVLSRIDVVSLTLTADDGKSIARVAATTPDAGAAARLFDFVKGVQSLSGLTAAPRRGDAASGTDSDARADLLGELARAAQLTRDPRGMMATITLPDDRAADLVQRVIEQHDRERDAPAAPN